ncbi:hypothetical protein SAMN04488100_1582 [Alkalibacterium putridalgicola]|uniref:Tetratricopeptide repeat-containing protein n=1 Tax=Alkalibacterium putridalgicola TaxID=426703 RepID=A0A1H7XR36_9LACT|nr:hypothetical protein [Alkalibacterium putridalgicola]GEK90339.1 hypothetical protein APU01nite_23780 [Alkalibacterium putridalgicola]SEM35449.1 hypothetical protein SAMN04488100_1582 [Alkalibacterium putridalgicola]
MTLALLLVLTTACNDETDELYNNSFQGGLDYIAAEDFIRAEVYFEQALEAHPDDQRTTDMIYQIQHYLKAVEHFDLEQYADSMEELEFVLDTENGSAGMAAKAQDMFDNAQLELEKLTVEAETEADEESKPEVEEAEPEKDIDAEELVEDDVETGTSEEEQSEENVTDESDAEVEQVNMVVAEETEQATESSSTVEEKPEEAAYTFEDFHGYYANFEGEPYNSEMVHLIIITDSKYYDIVIGWGEYAAYDIVDYSVDENSLFIAYDPPETEEIGMELEAGSISYSISENSNSDKELISQYSYTYYPLTEADFINTGLNPAIGELGEF